MYYIKVYDYKSEKTWIEKFDSYYKFRKRVIKLSYTRKLVILSISLMKYERN